MHSQDSNKDQTLIFQKLQELERLTADVDPSLKKEIEKLSEKIQKPQDSEKTSDASAWNKVMLARHKKRLTTMDYIDELFDDFMELHGDRLFKDDAAVVGGLAWFGGQPVTVIGHQKGRDVSENIKRNFGMAHPEGYRKALRLIKQAEKFNRPVICFIDTPGAYCGLGAEERGQGEAIARNLLEMSDLKVPLISIVIGEGGSGGALAFGVSNKIWMLENAIYSVLSPEGFASILWKDAGKAKQASDVMKITAEDLKTFGMIDEIVKESGKGVHLEPTETLEQLKASLSRELKKYQTMTTEEIVEERFNKFRNIGSAYMNI